MIQSIEIERNKSKLVIFLTSNYFLIISLFLINLDQINRLNRLVLDETNEWQIKRLNKSVLDWINQWIAAYIQIVILWENSRNTEIDFKRKKLINIINGKKFKSNNKRLKFHNSYL